MRDRYGCGMFSILGIVFSIIRGFRVGFLVFVEFGSLLFYYFNVEVKVWVFGMLFGVLYISR